MEQESKTGEFFSVSIEALDHIASQGGMAEEVLGYLVLARHATGKGSESCRLTAQPYFEISNCHDRAVSSRAAKL